MRGFLFELLTKRPWFWPVAIFLIVVGGVFWVWSEMQESQESEKMKQTERNRQDSIWKDS